MRFLKKQTIDQTLLVISDIHLGAGRHYKGIRNYLEDFHFDEELVDFLDYYTSEQYEAREVTLIINGDLFDLLAVPFVEYFDDEFWSEDAAKEKLQLIFDAHPEVMEAFSKFVQKKNKKLVYIIGNHDAEMIFESLQGMFLNFFPEKYRSRVEIQINPKGEYFPAPRVMLKHGHEYEVAHAFDSKTSIIEDDDGKKYFVPPWGSYYVTQVINKFKEIRPHVNAVRPIRKFMINGLIYDTLFTIRFALANLFYFVMVRAISIVKSQRRLADILSEALQELELFKNYEILTMDFLNSREDIDVLIVGHTHEPTIRTYNTGKTFINTGTWTKMYHLDFGKGQGEKLTFAQVDFMKGEGNHKEVNLNVWKGRKNLPFDDFN